MLIYCLGEYLPIGQRQIKSNLWVYEMVEIATAAMASGRAGAGPQKCTHNIENKSEVQWENKATNTLALTYVSDNCIPVREPAPCLFSRRPFPLLRSDSAYGILRESIVNTYDK